MGHVPQLDAILFDAAGLQQAFPVAPLAIARSNDTHALVADQQRAPVRIDVRKHRREIRVFRIRSSKKLHESGAHDLYLPLQRRAGVNEHVVAPVWGGATMTRYFDPVIHRFIELLQRQLPDAPAEDVFWCFQQLTGAITLTLSQTGRIDRLSGGLCRSSDLRAAYDRMVPYAVGGLRNVCGQASGTTTTNKRRKSSGRKRSKTT